MPASLSVLLRPRTTARHARPSKVAPVLAAGGLTLAFAVADSAALTASASAGGTTAEFERLAVCESGGNWAINTGNGYYGGLQFNLATWRGLGFGGYPHQASKATQIAAGQKLQGQRGWGPWPACSRKLGLSGGASTAPAAPARAAAATTAPRREAAARASRGRATAAPAFAGVLSTADRRTSAAVRTWQQRMRARGWKISVDGRFGPQTADVARRFAAQKRLAAAPGTVNAAVWAAAWTSPVT